MRKIITVAAAAVAVAALAYVGLNAWLAWGLPARPFDRPADGCKAKDFVRNGALWLDGLSDCHARAREALILKNYPNLATRQGEVLTISYAGKPVVQLAPRPAGASDFVPMTEACDEYRLKKAISVRDPVSRRPEPLAVVECHWDTVSSRLLVLPNGKRSMVEDVSASPDGLIIAVGDNYPSAPGASGFAIRDWASQTDIAAFGPACRVVSWQDASHLIATCMYDPGAHSEPSDIYAAALPFDAKVWRDTDGVWQMQATRWLSRRHFDDTSSGDTEYRPGFSLRPLPHFTGKAGT